MPIALRPGTLKQLLPLAGVFGLCQTAFAGGTDHALLAGAVLGSQIFQWRPFLAPFHSVLLHYPIGFVTIAALLEGYSLFRPSAELRRIARLVMWLSLGSAIAVAALGLMRANSGEYNARTLSLHRNYGVAVPVCLVLALLAQHAAFRAGNRRWLFVYRGLLVATLSVVAVAGHQGGNLTHGSQYLVQNAPVFVKELLGENEPAKPEPAPGAVEGVYAAKIRPIFETKCFQCHGEKKHKGGYRLDLPEEALKGGESGQPAIKPGDPMQSNLVRRILMPRDNDEVMPPDGKEPLSAEETLVLIRWIQSGAPFGEAAAAPAAAAARPLNSGTNQPAPPDRPAP